MSFQSLAFLLFFAVTLAVCLPLARRGAAARLALTAACAAFYLLGASHSLGGFAVLAFSAGLTRFTVPFLAPGGRGRRAIFAAAVTWHVGVLAGFKYAAFLTGGAASMTWAPLGLSFFTFQQIWFLKEVYTKRFPAPGEAAPDGWAFALFSFFFPTVSSGPILRPEAFFPQLTAPGFLRPTWDDAAAGVYAVSFGMAKKVLLADPLGVVVGNGWARTGELSAPGAWLVILGYTLQLYFDFSGYCDIAAGLARLLGVRLPVNFDSPYRARSVGEFWRRWHITLTAFLRECVYFPLGGSRRGAARTYANILLVYLISGLWHGAGWTFLLWGALHGAAQVGERLWGAGRERMSAPLRWAGTFLFVNLAWVFFRAPDMAGAFSLLRAAVSGGLSLPPAWLTAGLFPSECDAAAALAPALARFFPAAACAALYAAGLAAALSPGNTIRRMDTFRPTPGRCAAVCALLGWAVLSFGGNTTFLYSNF